MQSKLKDAIEKIDKLSKSKPIKVISHNDTDGITSAAIFSKALERWHKLFSLEIVKNLEDSYIEKLPDDHILILLDLGSGSLEKLSKKQTEIFILDHHELQTQNIPENITIINPLLLNNQENIAASAICYLFAKQLDEKQNIDLAKLAIIGMIGDMFEKNIGKVYDEILKDSETIVKQGLLLYPATRPIDKILEISSNPYIPGVSGSFKGVLELLREAGIEKNSKGFKSLAELDENEMANLGTAIMLKSPNSPKSHSELIGNIFLIKFFNTIRDAREISASINACSRMDHPEIALGFCLGNKFLQEKSEKLYTKYKKTISSALGQVEELVHISGKNYKVINAQDKIKDTIIGTVASIMSFSPLYPEGTIIIAMAYNEDKIKVSARLAGRKGRNVREILHKATLPLSTEIGGHPQAAGCLVPRDKESEFLKKLQQTLEIELIKV